MNSIHNAKCVAFQIFRGKRLGVCIKPIITRKRLTSRLACSLYSPKAARCMCLYNRCILRICMYVCMFYRSCSRSFRVSDSFFLSRRTVRFFSRSSRSFCSLSVSTFCSSGFFRLLASSRSNRDVNFSSSFSHSSC